MSKNLHVKNNPQKVTQISTYAFGGAGNAAARLNMALNRFGNYSSTLLARYMSSKSVNTSKVAITEDEEIKTILLTGIFQNSGVDQYRTELSNTLYSLPIFGINLLEEPLVREASIINLHWVSFFQSPETLSQLALLNKPVVWTLHDEWAFTGGCHYTAGCTLFKQDCLHCPQLSNKIYDIPADFLNLKQKMLGTLMPVVVTPSKWLAKKVESSRIMKDLRVEVIPNSIDTDIYKPVEKKTARSLLGLNPDGFYLLFGAETAREKRKGYLELIEALKQCLNDDNFNKKILEGREFTLLVLGEPNELAAQTGLPVINMGYLHEEQRIALLYSSADYYILPSLEDNLPNTVLEAFGCGTPVIAFNIGGIPDIVEHCITGFLVTAGNIDRLSRTIIDAFSLPNERVYEMGEKARLKAMSEYGLAVQAQRYTELYDDLQKNTSYVKINEESLTSLPRVNYMQLGVYPKMQALYCESMERFVQNQERAYRISEADRADRLQVILRQGQEFSELQRLHAEETQIWQGRLDAAEADRDARLQVILRQGQEFSELQRLHAKETQIWQGRLDAAEADRDAHLQVIIAQGQQLSDLQQQHVNLNESFSSARELLHNIGKTRLYRFVRRVGLWKWVEHAMKALDG